MINFVMTNITFSTIISSPENEEDRFKIFQYIKLLAILHLRSNANEMRLFQRNCDV